MNKKIYCERLFNLSIKTSIMRGFCLRWKTLVVLNRENRMWQRLNCRLSDPCLMHGKLRTASVPVVNEI